MSVVSCDATGARTGLSSSEYGLYGVTILAWGFSWIAMKGQVGTVAPEVSVFWRFVLAAAVMMSWSLLRGHNLRYGFHDHLRFFGLGVLLFSTNFTLFYYGALHLPSGLLAVVFSLASVLNIFLSMILFGQIPNARSVTAGLLGFAGIGFMFKPQILATDIDYVSLTGLALCTLGTLSFCFGNMVSASTQSKGIPVTPATAWGMTYGALFIGAFSLVRGNHFAIDLTVTYVGSLVFLAIVSSVIAFGAYLTLLGRIGSARAGYATVIFPVAALAISTVFEGYVWTASAITGLFLVLLGNLLMLRSR